MAARKLQTEIDRTLKKVSEGVELFESIYEKMQSSTNQTQKEKLELELKTQIKKLQRLRDQIKTWVASNDIKDKTQLLDNRKLIETQMEKFKACEKEMKTKAFSKEGLIQAAKLDPKEQEKEEATLWLQGQVEELQMQVEQTEAEIEALHGNGKKRNNKGSNGRTEELEGLNDRRKWHISRLEIVLRLVNNGSLAAEKVTGLKEDVSYFVESNTEEDFDEDEGIYDDLNLDEEEEKFKFVAPEDDDTDESDAGSEDLPPRTPSKRHDEESATSSKALESPVLKKASISLQLRKPSLIADAVKPPPNPNFAQQPMASILKAGLPARPPVTLPPIRYAAAAAAAVAPSTSQLSPPITSIPNPLTASIHTPSLPPSSSHESGVSSSPSLTHPSVASPLMSSSAASHQQDGSFYSGQDSPAISEAPAATSSPQPMKASPAPLQALAASSESQPTNGSHPPGLSTTTSYTSAAQPSTSSPLVSQQPPQFPPGVKVPQLSEQSAPNIIGGQRAASQPSQRASGITNSLSDLVSSFENVKQKASHRMANLNHVHKLLEGGYSSMPQPQDTEKPKYYVPRNPYQTPAFYPQSPNPVLSTAEIFAQLDVETLFYVFYFLPGTYQQYLAAEELKKQSWRFHIKYLTWFQRHSEPQAITEEYEQGVYVYFDWEGSWCQRKKSDFRFEYRYLSS